MSQIFAPTSLEKGVRALFIEELTGIESSDLTSLLATVVSSSADSEKYAWLGEAPQMAVKKDEVEFTSLSDAGYTITNQTFTAGLAVSQEDLEDDQIGSIRNRITRLAQTAMAHRNKLVTDLLINGAAAGNEAYDGEPFFSDTHPARGLSGALDNIITGTGTTTAQVAADINTGITTMMSFLAENGEPFHADMGSLAVVAPVNMRKPVLEALEATVISNTSNVQFNGVNILPVFSPRLDADDANDYYLLQTSGLRPLIIQDRVPLTFSALEQNSDTGFKREQYLYKIRWRGSSGYSHFQDAVKITNA